MGYNSGGEDRGIIQEEKIGVQYRRRRWGYNTGGENRGIIQEEKIGVRYRRRR